MTKSEQMARVKSKNTQPELLVRRLLSARGVRYRLHRKSVPGSPDIYIPRLCVALFVNGCFWHGHGCDRAALPKTNAAFWAEKISKNVARDRKNEEYLSTLGIEPLYLWTCQAEAFPKICATLAKRWSKNRLSG
jgi:DNA mismatch endonuclease (patch repair protein)